MMFAAEKVGCASASLPFLLSDSLFRPASLQMSECVDMAVSGYSVEKRFTKMQMERAVPSARK